MKFFSHGNTSFHYREPLFSLQGPCFHYRDFPVTFVTFYENYTTLLDNTYVICTQQWSLIYTIQEGYKYYVLLMKASGIWCKYNISWKYPSPFIPPNLRRLKRCSREPPFNLKPNQLALKTTFLVPKKLQSKNLLFSHFFVKLTMYRKFNFCMFFFEKNLKIRIVENIQLVWKAYFLVMNPSWAKGVSAQLVTIFTSARNQKFAKRAKIWLYWKWLKCY